MTNPPDKSKGSANSGPGSTRRRALSASKWVVLSSPVMMGLQLVRSLVLTRLLFPEAFGLMALVAVIIQGTVMCSDVGVGPAVIRHPRSNEPEFLQTAWTVRIIRGAIVWLAMCALAIPLSRAYGEPLLASMLPVAGLSVLIGAFDSTAVITHERDLRQGRLFVINIILAVFGAVLVIALAALLRNVWALVFASVGATTVRMVVTFRALPGIAHRFRLERAAARDLVSFGKWIFLSSIASFFAMDGDRLVLGKLASTEVLGLYSVALGFALVPRDVILRLSSMVVLPAVALRLRGERSTAAADVIKARGALLRVGLLLGLAVALIAPLFFRTLYDSRYWSAGLIAQFLSFAAWVTTLSATTGSCLMAHGNTRTLAIASALNLVVTFPASLLGYAIHGLPGFVIGFASGTAAGEVVHVLALRALGVDLVRQDLGLTALWVGAALGAPVAAHLAESALGVDPNLSVPVAAAIVWLGVGMKLWPYLKKAVWRGGTA